MPPRSPTTSATRGSEHGHLSLGIGAFGEILDELLEASGEGAFTIEG